ncbi:MAG: hypothetical protein JKY70_01490 [Mucilaginibacter sp.]|nr:hypothetical protein [Mucilaginibacter sp.]
MSRFRSKNIIGITGTGSMRFDFGQTNAGWLEFEADDMPDNVELSISEYNEPAILNQGAVHRIKTLAPVKHGNLYRLELNPELYEGVRFGWIHVGSHKRNWAMKNLRLVCQVKPVNYLGSFACSDDQLTKIWYTGAYTVKLNLMKDYLGAILMERSDRHSWTGDAYPSQAASMVAFGNYDMIKTNLIHTATLDNSIPSYSLYWVLSLIDYVNYSGDKAFGTRYIDNARKKLDKAYAMFDDPKDLNFYGWDERLGAGFENPTNPETQRAYQFLAIRCWMAFSKLASVLGQEKIGGQYSSYAAEKMKALRADKTWFNNTGLHASADAINTGLTTDTEKNSLYTKNFTSRVNRLSYSPFNEYFILQSLAGINKYDDALSSIKDCWGGQLDYGGTTFFEVYRPSWNNILGKNGAPVNNQCGYTSLTHPWSSGVTQWLSQEILGIKPLSPGFKRFSITPRPVANLTWLKGSMPTPFGAISIAVDLNTGINTISVPKGTQAEMVTLPLAGSLTDIYLNNKVIWKKGTLTKSDILLTDSTASFKSLKAGNYKYRLVYTAKKPLKVIVEPQWDYAINQFKQDSVTAGNWRSKFGKQGFVLFNFVDTGKNLERLPSFISKVNLKRQANLNVTNSPKTRGVLTDTLGNTGSLGTIVTQDPLACLQTMTMDVEATDTAEHEISLYFLVWDDQQRRSALEVFDLKTLNLLAPVQLVQHYQKGKYLTFKYKGSIRLRINQVRGKNAAVSGLFFD